jgi:hypothetical protein
MSPKRPSIAVVIVRPAISRGTGLPGSVARSPSLWRPRHPKRLGMSGGMAKQKGSPRPLTSPPSSVLCAVLRSRDINVDYRGIHLRFLNLRHEDGSAGLFAVSMGLLVFSLGLFAKEIRTALRDYDQCGIPFRKPLCRAVMAAMDGRTSN